MAQAGGDAAIDWSLVLSIVATVISVATFAYTVFIKPRRDLRQGSLARQLERHDNAVAAMRKVLAVETDGLEWAVRQVALEAGPDPLGISLVDRIEALKDLERRISGMKVDLMSPRLSRLFSDYATQLVSLRYPLERLRAGESLAQWDRDSLSASLNRELPEARIKLEQALDDPRAHRGKPPLLRVSLETRRTANRRAREEEMAQGPGC